MNTQSVQGLGYWSELTWYVLAVLIVCGLGITAIYFPFGPDQSVVMGAATSIRDGGLLYVDYWDNKQPGLYWFYALAGSLFGYTEQGVHTFELIFLLLFSGFLMLSLRPFLSAPYLSALAPIATIATYYAAVTEYELTQSEFVVSVPIFIGLFCVLKGNQKNTTTAVFWMLSGVAAAITVLFKLILVPIFIGFWVWGLWSARNQTASVTDLLGARILPVFVGGAGVIFCILFWFYQAGNLPQLIWTSFTYPTQALLEAPSAVPSRLITAAAFYTQYLLVWLPFAGYCIFRLFKNQAPQPVAYIAIWLVIACVLFLIQRFSWWQYHTLMFFVPTGLLAVFGLDLVIKDLFPSTESVRRYWASAILAVTLMGSLYSPFIIRTEKLLHHTFISGQGPRGYQYSMGTHYRRHWEDTRFLREAGSVDGPIYVFGHPKVYEYAQRDIPHAIIGSSWEFYLPEQVDDILQTLLNKNTAYVFVGVEDYKLFKLNRRIAEFIAVHYRFLKEDSSGKWFIRRRKEEKLIE